MAGNSHVECPRTRGHTSIIKPKREDGLGKLKFEFPIGARWKCPAIKIEEAVPGWSRVVGLKRRLVQNLDRGQIGIKSEVREIERFDGAFASGENVAN